MLRITFFGPDGELFTQLIQPGQTLIELAGPMTVMKMDIQDDGQPLFVREEPPRPIDVEEALTVLTDFVHGRLADAEDD